MQRVAEAIPLVDLKAAHREVAAAVRDGFDRVLANTAFILGEEVARFEQEYAGFIGTAHCIGVSNGTDALELALRAIGTGPGDEVIVPANTFAATAFSVVRAGAKPIFADCDEHSLLIDPAQIEEKLTGRTRAIVPVHLFGQTAPMAEIEALAAAAGVSVVEDAAQAQGARQGERRAGAIGVAAATSFYPGKNLGAYGDAGAVTTGDDALATRVRALHNYGSLDKYHHPETGFNCRLDALQAVVLRAKLEHLARWNELRRRAARRYDELLEGRPEVRAVATLPGNEHIYHLYVVRVGERDRVFERLRESGIGAGIHYPEPLHRAGAFAPFVGPGESFPVAERAACEVLSLPIYPQITAEQQERVVEALLAALA